ncbi:MAG TPA: hypothetical protein VN038_01470 [Dyadobacter sp.]|nr:hypothetical protein [Dyadobacter sp.]
MTITAKFKGLPRLGYAVGFWYDLIVQGCTVVALDGKGATLYYSSTETFFADWTDCSPIQN